MAKSKYPANEGWITITLEMKTADLVDKDQVIAFLSGGKPEEYEFPVMEQHGKKVKVISRHESRKPAAADQSAIRNPQSAI